VVDLGLAVVCYGLFVATLVRKDWIEAGLGFDPDRYGGSAEWLVTLLAPIGSTTYLFLTRPYIGKPARVDVERNHVSQVLRCVECGAESKADAVGWRAANVRDLDAHEPQPEVIVFCPTCYAREFQGD
jgi:hypothetical protein